MPRDRLIVEVRKDGEYLFEDDAETIADYFMLTAPCITRRAAIGGTLRTVDGNYTFRYNGKTKPWQQADPEIGPKPKPKRKPKMSIAEVDAAAKKAGMHYGEYVAKHGV